MFSILCFFAGIVLGFGGGFVYARFKAKLKEKSQDFIEL